MPRVSVKFSLWADQGFGGWRIGAAGERSAPWSSQPSRQDPTKQRAPHKAPMTKTSSAKANIWIGSSPGGPTGGAGGTGGGSVGVLGGGDGDCV